MILDRLSPRRRRHDAALAEPFPDAWRTVLDEDVALWSTLDDGERSRLEDLVRLLAADIDLERAQGFDPDDRHAPVVFGNAAMLLADAACMCQADARALPAAPALAPLLALEALLGRAVAVHRARTECVDPDSELTQLHCQGVG